MKKQPIRATIPNTKEKQIWKKWRAEEEYDYYEVCDLAKKKIHREVTNDERKV